MENSLNPSESVAQLNEVTAQEENKKYNRSAGYRKDKRVKGQAECNHIAGQFYDKLFKSSKFRPKLETNAVVLKSFVTPASESEEVMAKRLGLTTYKFNYPKRFIPEETVRKVFDVSKGIFERQLELTRVKRNNNFKYPGTKAQQNELHVRFAEYLAMLNLPTDFKKKYPYIYAILQDQFVTKIVMYRNMKKMHKMAQLLMQINIMQGLAFKKLYEFMAEIPNINEYLKSHPDKIAELKEIENVMEPLTMDPEDPQSKIKFQQLLNLDAYSHACTIHKNEDKKRYLYGKKQKYATRMLVIPND
jgi:hypothetical protein